MQSSTYRHHRTYRAEDALRESEEKYRNLVERVMMASHGQDGIIRYVNPRLAHMAGYTIEELTGAPIFDFFPKIKLIDRYRRRWREDVDYHESRSIKMSRTRLRSTQVLFLQ
jgi:PAS domain S-box-containing protein